MQYISWWLKQGKIKQQKKEVAIDMYIFAFYKLAWSKNKNIACYVTTKI